MAALMLPTQRRPHRGSLPGGSFQAFASSPPRSGRSRSFHFETSALDADAQLVLAQLQQLAIDLETSVSSSGAVVYQLELSHLRAGVRWSLARSFDDFHAFKKQMRTALRHGHVCAAGGCPWLENLLVSYFPARRALFFLRDASPGLIRRRRDALLNVLRSMQTFLLAHTNHSCTIVSQHVAPAFLRFLCGDDVDRGEEHTKIIDAMRRDAVRAVVLGGHAAIDKPQPSNASTDSTISSCSSAPVQPTAEEESSSLESAEEPPGNVCVLCSQAMPATNAYVMRLRCGHRFHDECVLPKLNESLQCPVCGKRDDEDDSEDSIESSPISPLSRRRSRSLFHEMNSV